MDDIKEKNIIDAAIISWKNNKNKFNYMSLKNATTVKELENGMDCNGNAIFIKSNLDKSIIHFGTPSTFNDEREFEFVCPEMGWLEFLIQDDNYLEIFRAKYNVCNDFDMALAALPEKAQKNINDLRNLLKNFGKYCADKYKDNYGVYCLAPSSYNSYFWREYCNDFNGICCEYNVDEICNNKNIIRMKVAYSDCGVEYLPQYVNLSNFPDFDKSTFNRELRKKLGSTPEKSKDAILKLMCTKPEKWIQELETRLVIMIKDRNDTSVNSCDIKAVPTKIYIGDKVSTELKDYLKKYCDSKNIGFEIVSEEDCVDFSVKIPPKFNIKNN